MDDPARSLKSGLFFLILITIFMFDTGCSIFTTKAKEKELVDSKICPALDVGSTKAFLNNGNRASYDQLKSSQSNFIFTSPLVQNPLDGKNVIELRSAQVQFDFEDDDVDVGDLGGFWARWKIILVPYDADTEKDFKNLSTDLKKFFHLSEFINGLKSRKDRIEVQLSGPFLKSGCEWGDTDLIGTQTLTYSNYGVYDWDFFPGVDRVIGVIYEGDEGVGDDFIAWLDIWKTNAEIEVRENGKFKIVFKALSDVSIGS